jgi:SAM-dependent methyltransferase
MSIFKATKTETTAGFYGELMVGKRTHWFWGKQRFDADKVSRSASVDRYFTQPVAGLIPSGARVLDVGCGTGILLPVLAPLCGELVGLEVSPAFVDASRQTAERWGLQNVTLLEASAERMPFADDEFDVLVVVDVLHHLFDLPACLAEMRRVLKPDGCLIVYEPSKLNPLLALLFLLDRNEWGALGLGTPAAYRRTLAPYFCVDAVTYSGLVIGPDSRFYTAIADFLNGRLGRPLLGWLLPKMQVVAHKRGG